MELFYEEKICSSDDSQQGGQSQGVESYDAVNDYTEDATVDGDSTFTSLSNSGTIVDDKGNTVTVKGTDGTVYVEGESDYTVTVDSYSDKADLFGASSTTQWSDYEVTKPEELA